MDGDHDIDICEEVTEEVLRSVYNELSLQNVWLEGTLLKPNMAISGQDCSEQAGVQEVAERTLRCLKRTVPAAVPGIVFLSGGQSDALATEHLNAMNKLPGTLPWKLSFSRSEEHTSELQSLMRTSYAVFCLKKKNSTPNKT